MGRFNSMRLVGEQSPAAERELPVALGSDLFCAGGTSSPDQSRASSSEARRQSRPIGTNSLIVALLSPWVLLMAESTQKVLFAIVILDIPIQFGTHLFYHETNAVMGALGGLNLSATTIALTALYLSWFARTLTRNESAPGSSLHMDVSLLIYFATMVLSVAVAQDASLALFEVFQVAQSCLVYFYVANSVRTRQQLIFVVHMLLIGCLVESIIMLAIRLFVTPASSWDGPIHLYADLAPLTGTMRVGGTVGSPNTAGAYLSLVLAIAAGLLLTQTRFARKWLAVAVLAFGSVALILTFSRGGWIALATATALICFFAWRQHRSSLKIPVTTLLIVVIIYLPFHHVISARLFGDDKGSAESRVPLDRLAFRMIEDHPILGIGANNLTVVMPRYLTSEFRSEWLYTVHNTYLLVWTEVGIFGLLAYLAFLFGALRLGWRCWKFGSPLLSPLALAFMAGIAGNMLHQGVDIFTDRPIQQLLWLIAGLLAAMYRLCKEDRARNSVPSLA
jgi:putative inorganic carbon (HCO3(-)) transporter